MNRGKVEQGEMGKIKLHQYTIFCERDEKISKNTYYKYIRISPYNFFYNLCLKFSITF